MKTLTVHLNHFNHVSDRIEFLETLIRDSVKYQIRTNTKHILNLVDDLSKGIQVVGLCHAKDLQAELRTLAETIHRYNDSPTQKDTKQLYTLMNNAFSDINDEE